MDEADAAGIVLSLAVGDVDEEWFGEAVVTASGGDGAEGVVRGLRGVIELAGGSAAKFYDEWRSKRHGSAACSGDGAERGGDVIELAPVFHGDDDGRGSLAVDAGEDPAHGFGLEGFLPVKDRGAGDRPIDDVVLGGAPFHEVAAGGGVFRVRGRRPDDAAAGIHAVGLDEQALACGGITVICRAEDAIFHDVADGFHHADPRLENLALACGIWAHNPLHFPGLGVAFPDALEWSPCAELGDVLNEDDFRAQGFRPAGDAEGSGSGLVIDGHAAPGGGVVGAFRAGPKELEGIAIKQFAWVQCIQRGATMACGGMIDAVSGDGGIPMVDGGEVEIEAEDFGGIAEAGGGSSRSAKEIGGVDDLVLHGAGWF